MRNCEACIQLEIPVEEIWRRKATVEKCYMAVSVTVPPETFFAGNSSRQKGPMFSLAHATVKNFQQGNYL
jgi:hypothetical protein